MQSHLNLSLIPTRLEEEKFYSEEFLEDFYLSAINELTQFAKIKFHDYEYRHPTNQPANIRYHLYRMDEKLEQFSIPSKENLALEASLRFSQLIGYFLYLSHHLEEDDELSAVVKSVLLDGTHKVDPNILFNEEKQKELKLLYDNLKKKNKIFKIELSEFLEIEKKEFDQAYLALEPYFTDSNSLSIKATEIANDLNNEKNTNGNQADLKFNTKILKSMHTNLRDPLNIAASNEFHYLTNHAKGHPSLKNKVKGGLIFFSSLLLLTTIFTIEIILSITIFPLQSSSLMFLFFLGTSSAKLGSLLGSYNGISSFFSGTRKDISKKMYDFQIIKQRIPSIPEESSLPTPRLVY